MTPHHPKKKHFFNQTRLHESNYNLLQILLGDSEQLQDSYNFPLSNGSCLRIQIIERHRYTSFVKIALNLPHLTPFTTDLDLEARIYHDAQVVEITHYQGHGRFAVKCETPNKQGYHADEKQQANRMLQESLRYAVMILSKRKSS